MLVGLLLVASVVLPPPVGPRPAFANAIVVNTTADDFGSGASCSLREAIQSANTDTAFGGCTAGSGTDTISLQAGQTYVLTNRDNSQFGFNGAPVIRSTIVIEGNGATITRTSGAASFRLFHVARAGDTVAGGVVAGAGDLTLRNVTLSGGLAQGGDGGTGRYGGGGGAGLGGALYVRGTLTIDRSTVQGNTAQGGNGGNSDAARTGSGGGGGVSARGGNGSTSPGVGGGGGGGFGGTGGDGAPGNNGGGEGGGIVANGNSGSGASGGSGGSPEGGDGRSLHSQSGGFGGGGGGGTGGVSAEGGNGGVGGGGGGAGFQAYSGSFAGGGGGAGSYGGPGGFGGGGGAAAANGAGGVGGGAGGSSSSSAGGGGGAGIGGAVFNDGGTVTVTNSTLSANTATGGAGGTGTVAGGAGQGLGGAVFTLNGTTTVLASTIASNTAAQGAAYEFRVDNGGTVNSTVSRSIVANSLGPADCRGTWDSGALTRAGADNLVEVNAPDTGCAGAVSSADPLLQPLAVVAPGQTAVHALTAGSPAIDAVAGGCPESTDQRGVSRPFDGDNNGVARCDIGAFERSAAESQPQSNLGITKTDGKTVVGSGQTTVYAIVVSNAGPSTATNARVQDQFPAAVTSVSWTCSPTVGSNCPGSGTGNIDTLVTLPSGGQVTFFATAALANNASGSLANTASVTPPAGITDPSLADNSATDTDTIVNCSARPPIHVTTVTGGGALTATLAAGAGAIALVQFGDGVQHPGVPTNAVIAVTSPGGGPSGITGTQTYAPPAGTSSVTLRITRAAAGRLVVPLLVSDACGGWRTFVGAGAGLGL